MRNYELTFLNDCIVGSVPMQEGERMLVREVSLKGDNISLINDGYAVITKIIEGDNNI